MITIKQIVDAAVAWQTREDPHFAEMARRVQADMEAEAADPVGYATARAAKARAASPEPVSVSHWGMVG